MYADAQWRSRFSNREEYHGQPAYQYGRATPKPTAPSTRREGAIPTTSRWRDGEPRLCPVTRAEWLFRLGKATVPIALKTGGPLEALRVHLMAKTSWRPS